MAVLRNEVEDSLAYELLERGDGGRNLREGALGVTFAEMQPSESLKGLCSRIGYGGSNRATVRGAVSMAEAQLRGR
jgi:hypothetical protein